MILEEPCPRACGRIMAGVTARGGCAAYVDFFNALSPEFLEAAGVDLENILWVRGSGAGMSAEVPALEDSGPGFDPDPAEGREQGPPGRRITAFRRAVKQVEILMQSGNFTLVVLDLAEPASARGKDDEHLNGAILPKGAWFRLQRAAEKSKSVLIILSGGRITSGASARVLSLRGRRRLWGGGKSPLREGEIPVRGMQGLEKHALLLGMESGISVMKGGSHGRSIIFHCHL